MLKEVFLGLAVISVPLIGAGVAINAMGKIGVTTFAKGLADFAIIVGGITGVITVLGALTSIPYVSEFVSSGITTIGEVFQGIWDIAIPLTGLATALVAMGLISPAIMLSGLEGFAIVVDGVSLVIASLGALSQIPGFTWLVGEGGDLLVQVGTILGEFAGSIIEGFVDKTFEGLDSIGTHLSNFMTNAQPFFDGVIGIDEESVNAVKTLAEVILTLTKQNIIEGLTSWFAGEVSLESFGEELATFAPYFKKYADNISGIDESAVEASTIASKAIAEFANNIPNEGGVLAWIVGDNTISSFGEMLPNFGKNLKKYSDNIKGLDSEIVENSVNVAKTIVEFSQNIPNQGGIVAWFTGDNTIDELSKQLPGFGKNLKQYADNVAGINSDVVSNSTSAAKSIVEFSKNIPNQGGIVAWFTGDNKLSSFGEELASFGEKFKNYYENIRGVSIEQVNNTSSAIGNITDQLVTIKNGNLSNVAEEYGNSIKSLCKKIKDALSNDISVSYYDVWEIGRNVCQGIIDGLESKSWSVCYTAQQIAKDLLKKMKKELDINSPSRVMENEVGKFIPLGVAVGIEDSAPEAINSAKEMAESVTSAVSDNIDIEGIKGLTDDISINPSDYEVDTNQFIDYGQISGAIATQSKINASEDLMSKITQAIINGMKNASVQVEIEARTDEGTIVKKASKGFNEYVMQTGELPFAIP